MPYIHRNSKNEIIGLTRWSNGSYEILPDDDVEVMSFNNQPLNEDANTQFLNTSKLFCYPGYTVFNIPSNDTNIIKVKLWGAGGGSSATNSLGQFNKGFSGDYVACNIDTSTLKNRNLIIHIGGKGKKSIANGFGYSDGAGGGGCSSIMTFDGDLLVEAVGGNGGNGVSYDVNNSISAKLGNADNGGLNGGSPGGLGEMGAGGLGGKGGGATYVNNTLLITSAINVINGIDDKTPNTSDPYYIPGVNIGIGGITATQKQINGVDGGNGLVVITW